MGKYTPLAFANFVSLLLFQIAFTSAFLCGLSVARALSKEELRCFGLPHSCLHSRLLLLLQPLLLEWVQTSFSKCWCLLVLLTSIIIFTKRIKYSSFLTILELVRGIYLSCILILLLPENSLIVTPHHCICIPIWNLYRVWAGWVLAFHETKLGFSLIAALHINSWEQAGVSSEHRVRSKL